MIQQSRSNSNQRGWRRAYGNLTLAREVGSENENVDFYCLKCKRKGEISSMVQCMRCQISSCHIDCLRMTQLESPDINKWFCYECIGADWEKAGSQGSVIGSQAPVFRMLKSKGSLKGVI